MYSMLTNLSNKSSLPQYSRSIIANLQQSLW